MLGSGVGKKTGVRPSDRRPPCIWFIFDRLILSQRSGKMGVKGKYAAQYPGTAAALCCNCWFDLQGGRNVLKKFEKIFFVRFFLKKSLFHIRVDRALPSALGAQISRVSCPFSALRLQLGHNQRFTLGTAFRNEFIIIKIIHCHNIPKSIYNDFIFIILLHRNRRESRIYLPAYWRQMCSSTTFIASEVFAVSNAARSFSTWNRWVIKLFSSTAKISPSSLRIRIAWWKSPQREVRIRLPDERNVPSG